jgi:hypothetical protein
MLLHFGSVLAQMTLKWLLHGMTLLQVLTNMIQVFICKWAESAAEQFPIPVNQGMIFKRTVCGAQMIFSCLGFGRSRHLNNFKKKQNPSVSFY